MVETVISTSSPSVRLFLIGKNSPRTMKAVRIQNAPKSSATVIPALGTVKTMRPNPARVIVATYSQTGLISARKIALRSRSDRFMEKG